MSKEGIMVDLTKIEVIPGGPRPTLLTKVRSFVRLVGYYRQFDEGFPQMQHR